MLLPYTLRLLIINFVTILVNSKIDSGRVNNHYETLLKYAGRKGEPYHRNEKVSEFLFLRSNYDKSDVRRKLVFPETLNPKKKHAIKNDSDTVAELDHVVELNTSNSDESPLGHSQQINFAGIPSSTVCTQNYTESSTKMTTITTTPPTTTTKVTTTLPPSKGVRWKLGNIPVLIDPVQYERTMVHKVKNAMAHIEESSCIKFVLLNATPTDTQLDYIFVTNPTHKIECIYLDLDEIPTRQIKLVLGYNCLSKTNIVRGLLRAIGMKSEVNHPKRDHYVRVLWENIQSRYLHLFRKSSINSYLKYVEYDPHSIMHFEDLQFSKNGQPTIAAVQPGLRIRPSKVITSLDRIKIERLIGDECKKRTAEKIRDTCKTVINHNENHDYITADHLAADDDHNDITDDNPSSETIANEVNNKVSYSVYQEFSSSVNLKELSPKILIAKHSTPSIGSVPKALTDSSTGKSNSPQ